MGFDFCLEDGHLGPVGPPIFQVLTPTEPNADILDNIPSTDDEDSEAEDQSPQSELRSEGNESDDRYGKMAAIMEAALNEHVPPAGVVALPEGPHVYPTGDRWWNWVEVRAELLGRVTELRRRFRNNEGFDSPVTSSYWPNPFSICIALLGEEFSCPPDVVYMLSRPYHPPVWGRAEYGDARAAFAKGHQGGPTEQAFLDLAKMLDYAQCPFSDWWDWLREIGVVVANPTPYYIAVLVETEATSASWSPIRKDHPHFSKCGASKEVYEMWREVASAVCRHARVTVRCSRQAADRNAMRQLDVVTAVTGQMPRYPSVVSLPTKILHQVKSNASAEARQARAALRADRDLSDSMQI